MDNENLDNLALPIQEAPEPNTEAEEQTSEQPEDTSESDDLGQVDDVETEEVDLDGKTYKLPKNVADIVKTRENMNRDATQKWQSAAEFRREAEAYHAEAVEDAATQMALIDDVAQSHSIKSRIDYLNSINPMTLPPDQQQQYMIEKMTLQQNEAELRSKIEERKSGIAAFQEREVAKLRSQAKAALEKPDERFGWAGKFDEPTRTSLTNFGKDLGFSDGELSSITNPIAIKTLHLAKIGLETLKKQRAATNPQRPVANPVPQVGGAKAKGTVNPDKLSTEEWVKFERARMAKRGR